jgi:hypothetical protein
MPLDPCVFCGRDSKLELHLIVAPIGVLRARLPICSTHGSALAVGDWRLEVKAGDMVRSVRGHREDHSSPF